MKTKKIISVLLAGALAATAAISVSAAELTDNNPDGSTEVTARIEGGEPGAVSYIITIPDSVTFGNLTQPESEVDSYKYCNFRVEATKIDIKTTQTVSVFVKDGSEKADGEFYLTQKDVESPFSLNYDMYERSVNDENISNYTPMNKSGDSSEYGYHLCTFTAGTQEQAQDVTLALNQKALYGQNLNTIAGDYSGNLVFHSALRTL